MTKFRFIDMRVKYFLLLGKMISHYWTSKIWFYKSDVWYISKM